MLIWHMQTRPSHHTILLKSNVLWNILRGKKVSVNEHEKQSFFFDSYQKHVVNIKPANIFLICKCEDAT